MPLLIVSGCSSLISFLIVGLIKRRFYHFLQDIPNSRSSHTHPTPRGGGLGFIIAFAITCGAAAALPNRFIEPLQSINLSLLWLILTPLTIIGILDDRYSISAKLRYLVQLAVAGLAVAWFGPFPQPWLSSLGHAGSLIEIALTAISITAMINFYNFMDGLDGLVAGVTAVQLGFLALYLNQPILWLLVAALLGFLRWNWSPAKIFMGDAGSTVLGAVVAIFLLYNNANPTSAWSALTITLPLIGDATYTLIRRLHRHENIFKAHRSHLYQRLHQKGWSHAQVAITYIVMTFLAAANVSSFGQTGAWMSLTSIVIAIVLGEVYLQFK